MAVELKVEYSPKNLSKFAKEIADIIENGKRFACPCCHKRLEEFMRTDTSQTDENGEIIAIPVKIIKCANCLKIVKEKIENQKEFNVYLDVAFVDKNVAKEYGAMFDPTVKLWYYNTEVFTEMGREFDEEALSML